MRAVSAREANQSFSRILHEAEGGESVVITRRGKPVAVLAPYPPPLSVACSGFPSRRKRSTA